MKFRLILLCLTISTWGHSQDADPWKDYHMSSSPEDKLEILEEIINAVLYSIPDSAKVVAKEMENLAERVNSPAKQVTARRYLAVAMAVSGDPESALKHYRLAHRMGGNSKAARIAKVRVTQNQGTTMSRIGEIDSAHYFYRKGLQEALALGTKENEALLYNSLGGLFSNFHNNGDSAEYYQKKALEIYASLGDDKKVKETLSYLGNTYKNTGRYWEALEHYETMIDESPEMRDQLYNAMSLCYEGLGEYEKAIEHIYKAIEYNMDQGNEEAMYANLSNVGIYYQNMGEHVEARRLFRKVARYNIDHGNLRSSGRKYHNIANTFLAEGNGDSALVYFRLAVRYKQEYDSDESVGFSAAGIASSFARLAIEDSAAFYFEMALSLQQNSSSVWFINTLANYGLFLVATEDYANAVEVCSGVHDLASEVGDVSNISMACECLFHAYDGLSNYELALKYHKEFVVWNDSLEVGKNLAEITRRETRLEFRHKEREDSVRNAQALERESLARQKTEAELESKRSQEIMLYGGLSLVLVFAFFLLNRFMVTRRQKKLIELQKLEVEDQSQRLQEKNREVLDSITYAETIQKALLTSEEYFHQSLGKEFFVLYRPRDIVSGDFYWCYKPSETEVMVAAVDCTGHGVPGAFMSCVGNALLNEVVIENGEKRPGKVLDEMRNGVIKALKQGEGSDSRDGMDMALIRIDYARMKVHFAGANNPLYHIRNGELTQIEANKESVGYSRVGMSAFDEHEVSVETGDRLYLFSDGYADQFGGPREKKFKYSKLRELLVSLESVDMKAQEQKLVDEFEAWKGAGAQVDDVCIIGVKI